MHRDGYSSNEHTCWDRDQVAAWSITPVAIFIAAAVFMVLRYWGLV
jgi:hypothetical protein